MAAMVGGIARRRVGRWHVLAGLVVEFATLSLALNLPPGWANSAPIVDYLVVGTPFLIALAYGMLLSSIESTILERLAVPWHAVLWIVSAFTAGWFAIWAAVNGAPLGLGLLAAAVIWVPVIALPALASLAYGSYVVSRLSRDARESAAEGAGTGRLVLRVLIEATRAVVLLLRGAFYGLALIAILIAAAGALEAAH